MHSFRLIFSLAYFLLVFGLYSVCSVQAGEIENLYEASVVVNSESERSDRKLLLNSAFSKVLLKVTGSDDFKKLPNWQQLIGRSESLVQKFSFQAQQTNNSSSESSTSEQQGVNSSPENVPENETENEPEQKTLFWARFNKQLTNQLLKENQLPVWGSLRPDTLIWLSIEKSHQRNIVSPSNSPSVTALLKKVADSRGITLLFPFGDLQDQNKLSMTDLWGNYSQAIKAASIRYNSQAILAVRIYQEPSGLWLARWSLYVLDKSENWQSSHENLSTLLARGISSLADRLAALFAVRTDDVSRQSSIVQINNVTDFEGYLRVSDYFKRVSAIQSYKLLLVKGDSLSYRVNYYGDEQYLIQSLILGEVLQKVETSTDEPGNDEQPNQTEFVPVLLDEVKPGQGSQKLVQPNKLSAADKTDKTAIETSSIEIDAVEPSAEIKPDIEFWLAR